MLAHLKIDECKRCSNSLIANYMNKAGKVPRTTSILFIADDKVWNQMSNNLPILAKRNSHWSSRAVLVMTRWFWHGRRWFQASCIKAAQVQTYWPSQSVLAIRRPFWRGIWGLQESTTSATTIGFGNKTIILAQNSGVARASFTSAN